MQFNFDASVSDIVGLADYRPATLPEWMRLRLDYLFSALEDAPSDGELVDEYIDEGREWVGGWGTATVDGDELSSANCRTLILSALMPCMSPPCFIAG